MNMLNRNHPNNSGAFAGQIAAGCEATSYGFAFIKSGFEPVENELVADFNAFGIEVVGACPIVMEPPVVSYIYRDSSQEPFYPAMHDYLVTRPVIAMALHSDTQNTQEILNDLKCGTNGLPSLRQKYAHQMQPLPEHEIAAWYQGAHPYQDEVTVHLTQKNVFHAADTPDEAITSLRLISKHNPEFWAGVRQNDPRIRKLVRYIL